MAPERPLKFWGWGYEDQQPAPADVRAAAAGIREHLGFGLGDVDDPPRLDDLSLPEPRVEPPPALRGICSSSRYERATHAYGKAYRDVVRAFRRRLDHPPDVVARPRDDAEVEALLDWCSSAGVAAIPFGGGTSVVGGVEARLEGDHAGVVSIDLHALDRVLEVDPVSRAARIQAGAAGPLRGDQLRPHAFTLRHFPQAV